MSLLRTVEKIDRQDLLDLGFTNTNPNEGGSYRYTRGCSYVKLHMSSDGIVPEVVYCIRGYDSYIYTINSFENPTIYDLEMLVGEVNRDK